MMVVLLVVCVHRRRFAADLVAQLGGGGDKVVGARLGGEAIRAIAHEIAGSSDGGRVRFHWVPG